MKRFKWMMFSLTLGCLIPGVSAETPAKAADWHWDLWIAYRQAFDDFKDKESLAPPPEIGRRDMTLSLWIQSESDGALFAKAMPDGVWVTQGKTLFIREGRIGYDIGWVGTITGRRAVADGQWHHIAFVSSNQGAHQTIYVDGEKDAEGQLLGGPDPEGSVFKIGYCSTNFPGDDSAFEGKMDEVRIYNRAFDAEEIRSLYKEAPSIMIGLTHHYPLDEANDLLAPQGAIRYGNFPPRSQVALFSRNADRRHQGLHAQDPHTALIRLIWEQLESEYTDANTRQAIAWEREDAIWTGDGQIRTLASRYAQAARVDEEERQALQVLANRAKTFGDMKRLAEHYQASRRAQWVQQIRQAADADAISQAVQTLRKQFPKRYPSFHVGESLGLWDSMTSRWLDELPSAEEVEAWKKRFDQAKKNALIESNPLFDFDEIVFIKRKTYQSSHYYTDFIDGCAHYGGNISILNWRTGEVRDIAPAHMTGGIFGRFDLSFDGKKIVFDWKVDKDHGFRIYEINTDGTGLRQITFEPDDEEERVRLYNTDTLGSWAGKPMRYRHYTDDMHPAYLPDGGIVFISTRCEYGILCDGPDVFSTTVLYRVDADGSHMTKLSNSSVSEVSPSVMNDGRILYSRWEYVDKGAVSVKCLWAMKPDGSGSVEIYGNDIADPNTLLFGRAIPGLSNLFVTLATPHCCPIPGVGSVLRIDTTRDLRTLAPLTYITPHIKIDPSGHTFLIHNRNGQWVRDRQGPIFKDPFPLDDKHFLVAYNPDSDWNDPTGYGLYLLTENAVTVPIHLEEETSCWGPQPLRARPRPPVIPTTTQDDLAQKNLALCVVTDIYAGMEGIERGAAQYIRINEQVPRPWGARRYWDGDVYDQQHAAITKDTHLGLKVQHGIVPIESDGSAAFLVPADANVFFQVLDENYMELQRERTFVNYRPGEVRSCVGCHERAIEAPSQGKNAPLALRRAPSAPGPQPGEQTGRRVIHYPTDVQPILDKYCIQCHSGAEPKAKLDLTGEATRIFSRSYENILARGLVPIIGENHPKWENVEYLPPKTLGSHQSKLIQHLLAGHNDIELTQEEMVRLTTWVDSNAQYYGSYYGRRNTQYKDHPNYRPTPTFADAIRKTAPLPKEER